MVRKRFFSSTKDFTQDVKNTVYGTRTLNMKKRSLKVFFFGKKKINTFMRPRGGVGGKHVAPLARRPRLRHPGTLLRRPGAQAEIPS